MISCWRSTSAARAMVALPAQIDAGARQADAARFGGGGQLRRGVDQQGARGRLFGGEAHADRAVGCACGAIRRRGPALRASSGSTCRWRSRCRAAPRCDRSSFAANPGARGRAPGAARRRPARPMSSAGCDSAVTGVGRRDVAYRRRALSRSSVIAEREQGGQRDAAVGDAIAQRRRHRRRQTLGATGYGASA